MTPILSNQLTRSLEHHVVKLYSRKCKAGHQTLLLVTLLWKHHFDLRTVRTPEDNRIDLIVWCCSDHRQYAELLDMRQRLTSDGITADFVSRPYVLLKQQNLVSIQSVVCCCSRPSRAPSNHDYIEVRTTFWQLACFYGMFPSLQSLTLVRLRVYYHSKYASV